MPRAGLNQKAVTTVPPESAVVTAPRRLTSELIVRAAVDIADAEGCRSATLTRVAAELGCHVTSLRTHIATLDELQRQMALFSVVALADELWEAALGVTGPEAIRAIAVAYRRYGEAHRGRTEVTALCMRRGIRDAELSAAGERSIQPLRAVLRTFGLREDAAEVARQAFVATIRGFIEGEAGRLYPGTDANVVFEAIIDLYLSALQDGTWLRGRNIRRGGS